MALLRRSPRIPSRSVSCIDGREKNSMKAVQARIDALRTESGDQERIPMDLVTASGSGFDTLSDLPSPSIRYTE